MQERVELLSTSETAKVLRLSRGGVLLQERKNLLHPRRDSRGVRWFERSEVEALARKRRGIRHGPRRLSPFGL